MILTIYDKITGQIIRAISISPQMKDIQVSVDEAYIESDAYYFQTEHYVSLTGSEPKLTLKQAMAITCDKSVIQSNDEDVVTIEGLPDDCQVTIEGDTYTVTDNVFELTVPLPGIYNITIEKFPFLPKEVQIEAIA